MNIFYGQLQDSLYGDGWDGVDLEASHTRFCVELERRIKARWPDVTVEVGRETDRSWVDGFGVAANDEIAELVNAMAEDLYQREPDAWVVLLPLALTLTSSPDDEAPPPDVSDERFGSVEDAAARAAELGYDGEVFDGERRRGWVHADGGWTSC